MKRGWVIFFIVLGAIIALRIVLEPVVKHYVNKTLRHMEGYQGSIEDVDINLYRGAYVIEGLEIKTTTDSLPQPFIKLDSLDLSIHWDALLNGKIVGEVILIRPEIIFISEKEGDQEQTGEEQDWVATLEELMPLTVNQFQVIDGKVSFQDPSVNPPVDITMDRLEIMAKNLSNIEDSTLDMPATVTASATSLGNGKLNLDMRMDVLNETPEFDAKLKFMSVNLPDLNDFISAYANFDVEEGVFSVITEIRADNGKLSGYIKPFFENLKVFSLEKDLKEDDGFFRKIWEGLVGLGSEVFENQSKNQVATEIPIEGDISSPEANIPKTIFNILKNAFVNAFEKRFESSAEARSPP